MHWKKYKISKTAFRELNEVKTSKAWSDFLLRILALFLPLFGIYHSATDYFFITVVLVVVFGVQFRFTGWAGYGHELYHGKVFRSKKLNRVLFIIFSALNWKNFGFFDVFHPIHHRDTLQTGGDLEGYVSKGRKKLSMIDKLASYSLNLPRAILDIKILILNSIGSIKTEPAYIHALNESDTKKIVAGARATLIIQLIALTFLVNIFGFILGFFVLFSPYIFTFLNDQLATLQHKDGLWDTDDFNLNTNTVILNPLISFLYANMNYHKEHHMYPSIPFYNLPRLREEILRVHPDENL